MGALVDNGLATFSAINRRGLRVPVLCHPPALGLLLAMRGLKSGKAFKKPTPAGCTWNNTVQQKTYEYSTFLSDKNADHDFFHHTTILCHAICPKSELKETTSKKRQLTYSAEIGNHTSITSYSLF